MCDKPIIFESDSKGSVSSSSKGGIESESHSFLSVSGGLELGIIILSDDSKIEESYGKSLEDEALSMTILESMFPVKSNEDENLAETPIPPCVLTKAKIEASRQRRKHVIRFVQTYQESIGHDPSNAKIARDL